MREKTLHTAASMTVAAYARHRKVSRRAVYDALAAGRITRLAAGTIDAAAADRSWTANTSHVGGRQIKAKPAAKARRRARSPLSAQGVAAGETEARTLLRKDGAEVLSFADARRARELVKLAREALELKRLSADTLDRAELNACTFRLWRTVRDRLDAAVGRESPLLAARLGVEEGRMYRELRTFVRGIEQEISDRGAVKLLAEAGQAGDEDEEVRP